ncbi:dehydratase [Streptomyces sp. AS58]|uniref:MaoC/PaaZ C-terminal domain-containing protein n=1 Tax=Streptomyces sp. AS58 TaxID=1519489 RepID=UPI0006AEDA8A|nr:MaoC/PaaZ C-terminal domain-containing protein [Streptomyces sp. AS58]KOV59946.1 dehydratase [Streptomyces sp. AS58]
MADRRPSPTAAASGQVLHLALGAALSPFKRPRPDAGCPGTRLVRSGVPADPDRLAAYERVCGFPPGDGALPLTYPHVLGFPLAVRLMSDRRFPLPLLGLVHTSVEITRRTVLPAAAEYELAVHVGAVAAHRRGTEATLVTEVRAGGQLVWESRSTYLSRHRTDAPPAERAAPDPLPVLAEWRLGADTGRRYGAVSGDRNPIHLHPLTARPFGFRRAVAHGMWTVARCLAEHPAPEAVRMRAAFRAPVLLPGTVQYAADGGRFELRRGERRFVTGEVAPLGSDGRR